MAINNYIDEQSRMPDLVRALQQYRCMNCVDVPEAKENTEVTEFIMRAAQSFSFDCKYTPFDENIFVLDALSEKVVSHKTGRHRYRSDSLGAYNGDPYILGLMTASALLEA